MAPKYSRCCPQRMSPLPIHHLDYLVTIAATHTQFDVTAKMTCIISTCSNNKFHQANLYLGIQNALAIRRVFSLIDMITNTKFSNCPLVFKIGAVQQQNMQSKHQNTFQSNISLASSKNLRFLLPPLVLRLSTGCHLDQTLSKCLTNFKK